MEIDVRPALGAIRVPTVILGENAQWAIGAGRYLADHIPGARFVAMPGADHLFTAHPESSVRVLETLRSFLGNLPPALEADRVLTTVLFTDIVSSTSRLTEVGDRQWARLLDRYFASAREEIGRYRGRWIKSTGDGVLATFDGPTRAVRCAAALREQGRAMGLETRSGLHTGECILSGDDVQGIAVHIAARVADLVQGGEVRVSGTLRDLSVGSNLRFTDRGVSPLRGVDGEWRTYSVDQGPAS